MFWLAPDNDGDGFTSAQGDCDDNNANINLQATESSFVMIDETVMVSLMKRKYMMMMEMGIQNKAEIVMTATPISIQIWTKLVLTTSTQTAMAFG